ncbi:MAG: hypothetical protein ACO1OB_24260 [Archangium sp.]
MLSTLLLATVLSQTFPDGARDAAFLVKDDGDFVVLKLRFGEAELDSKPSLEEWKKKVPVKLAGPVTLFDDKGVLATVGSPKFAYQLTCENDGGKDDAMNCEEARGEHWTVELVTANDLTSLRCCGP